MTNEETIDILNNLLTKAYDAEQGYEHAAEKCAESPSLHRFFQSQSSLRLSIGRDLKTIIAQYGGEPDKGASLAAKAHQIWITMRDFVQGGDNEALLEECERGEEAALAEYEEALGKGLPADVRELLMRQRGEIADALQTVRAKESAA